MVEAIAKMSAENVRMFVISVKSKKIMFLALFLPSFNSIKMSILLYFCSLERDQAHDTCVSQGFYSRGGGKCYVL